MTAPSSPTVIKMLAHDLRWQIIRHLTRSDLRVHELVERLEQPTNLVSYHLKQLRDSHLVANRRSDLDGRDIYYSLHFEALRQQLRAVEQALLDSQPESGLPSASDPDPVRVLVVCTHNSARSQIAEAWLKQLGGEYVSVASAGSHPTQVHPDTVAALSRVGIDISGHDTHHVSDYLDESFDYVITVCDLAREVCPHFEGGEQMHWGLPDPTSIDDDAKRDAAFDQLVQTLKSRVDFFLHSFIFNRSNSSTE